MTKKDRIKPIKETDRNPCSDTGRVPTKSKPLESHFTETTGAVLWVADTPSAWMGAFLVRRDTAEVTGQERAGFATLLAAKSPDVAQVTASAFHEPGNRLTDSAELKVYHQ